MLGAIIAVGLICRVLLAPVYACAVCVGSEDQGYFWGVLFLMSMPFAVGSFIGGWLWYHYRRDKTCIAASARTRTVQPQTPRPASGSSVSDRPNGEPQAYRA
jgi:hypothetical protein